MLEFFGEVGDGGTGEEHKDEFEGHFTIIKSVVVLVLSSYSVKESFL